MGATVGAEVLAARDAAAGGESVWGAATRPGSRCPSALPHRRMGAEVGGLLLTPLDMSVGHLGLSFKSWVSFPCKGDDQRDAVGWDFDATSSPDLRRQDG